LARRHGSDLLSLEAAFGSHAGGAVCTRRRLLGRIGRPCWAALLPGWSPALVRLSASLRPGLEGPGGASFRADCASNQPITLRVTANSPRPETSPGYLTRLGTFLHRSWPLSSCSRYWRRANAARGTGEFCLRLRSLQSGLRGVCAYQPAQPFPSRLGLSWISRNSLRPPRASGFFQ